MFREVKGKRMQHSRLLWLLPHDRNGGCLYGRKRAGAMTRPILLLDQIRREDLVYPCEYPWWDSNPQLTFRSDEDFKSSAYTDSATRAQQFNQLQQTFPLIDYTAVRSQSLFLHRRRSAFRLFHTGHLLHHRIPHDRVLR